MVTTTFLSTILFVYRFAFKNGTVSYQCRFLESNTYKKNKAAQRIVHTEFGTKACPDPCKTIFHRYVYAKTSIIQLKQYYATYKYIIFIIFLLFYHRYTCNSWSEYKIELWSLQKYWVIYQLSSMQYLNERDYIPTYYIRRIILHRYKFNY